MNKTLKIYLIFLFFMLGLIVFIDLSKPRPINWNQTYITKDKIPYGLFVLNQELPKLLEGVNLTKVDDKTIYEFLVKKPEPIYHYNDDEYQHEETIEEETIEEEYTEEETEDTSNTNDEDNLIIKRAANTHSDFKISDTLLNTKDTWLYINRYFDIDKTSNDALLAYVKNGGHAFLSAQSFPDYLLDSLKLTEDYNYSMKDTMLLKFKESNINTNLVYGAHGRYFKYKKGFLGNYKGYFTDKDNKKLPYFLEVPYGDGLVYLHLYPAMFANVNLLKDNNYQHAEVCLAYLPNTDVYWYLKNQTGVLVSNHPLRFIKDHPSLKWSWYLAWILVFIFLIFTAKRKQRVVPIIPPVKNTTVDFTKTIGNLYFQEKDYLDLMNKKITFFLERVRTELLMDTNVLDEVFIKRYQAKSGKPLEDVQNAINQINQLRKTQQATQEDLIALNEAINKITD